MDTAPDMATLMAPPLCISKSYASEILNAKRKPARLLAIRIFRVTGWRHSTIADLSDDEMDMLERIEARAA